MTIEQMRAQVKGSVWRGIAQSGVDMAALSAEQQNRLVDAVTDSVLVSVNEVMGDVQKEQARQPLDLSDEEKVLWEGRPFLSMVESYTLTSERLKIVTGLLGKDVDNFELIRIQDINVTQNLSERIFNIGDITIHGTDASQPNIVLRNITDPQQVYERLRRAWLDARKRYGLQFREEM